MSALMWFRRDLRVTDNAALARALQHAHATFCVFVFDRDILDVLPPKRDRRVEFIWESVRALQSQLRDAGGDLIVLHDIARAAIPLLAAELDVDTVFANEDYEPQAMTRDAVVESALVQKGIAFVRTKDTVIFEKSEVLTQAGRPYTVFTPYKNAWRKRLTESDLAPHSITEMQARLARPKVSSSMPSLTSLGFETTDLSLHGVTAGEAGARKAFEDFVFRMDRYKDARDFPAVKGVSYLSIHNRFGTISIRELVATAHAECLRKSNPGAETWLSELIWRDFYFQILFHHPHVVNSAFRREYDAIQWPNDRALFAAWCEARTGYPIIDAAMRQLNQTGYMHNRLRMIVASFLTKDLLIDWRWGEKYFADHLNDFDLAANNGGWQWAASTGCDAQPYFRIFNPVTQSERFDPHGKFIRRYVPELAKVPEKWIHAPWQMPPLEQHAIGVSIGKTYPFPVVDHAVQREKALALYQKAKT